MFDSLTVAQCLTDVRMSRELADATADAIREAAEYGHHVMPETLRAELSAWNPDSTVPCTGKRTHPGCSPIESRAFTR